MRFRLRCLTASLVLTIFQQQPVLPHNNSLEETTNPTSVSQAAAVLRQCSWSNRVVGKPVFMTAQLPDRTQKAYMFYAARSESGSQDIDLELAVSSDGRNFSRLPAEQSPYGVTGQILPARSVVPQGGPFSAVQLGQPVISRLSNGLKITFYHVAMKGDHAVSAGIATASSEDGIHWQLDKAVPMKISLTGGTSGRALNTRLSQLSVACAQM
jgi:hypothetical protein